ncbi:MAG: hypothetical protein WDW38_002324 [Sanguina aurantia]
MTYCRSSRPSAAAATEKMRSSTANDADDSDGGDSADGGNDPSTGSADEEEDSSESEGAEEQGGVSDAEGSDGRGVASTSEGQSGRKAKRQRKGQGQQLQPALAILDDDWELQQAIAMSLTDHAGPDDTPAQQLLQSAAQRSQHQRTLPGKHAHPRTQSHQHLTHTTGK